MENSGGMRWEFCCGWIMLDLAAFEMRVFGCFHPPSGRIFFQEGLKANSGPQQ